MALGRCTQVPLQSLSVALGYTQSARVHASEIVLGRQVASVSGFAVPTGCLAVVQVGAPPGFEVEAYLELGAAVSSLCLFQQLRKVMRSRGGFIEHSDSARRTSEGRDIDGGAKDHRKQNAGLHKSPQAHRIAPNISQTDGGINESFAPEITLVWR
jgi:hypothetical protein